QYRAGGKPFPGRLLPAFCAGTPGAYDRNRAGQQAGHQPQVPLGTPSAPGHSAQEDHQLSPLPVFRECYCANCYLRPTRGNTFAGRTVTLPFPRPATPTHQYTQAVDLKGFSKIGTTSALLLAEQK